MSPPGGGNPLGGGNPPGGGDGGGIDSSPSFAVPNGGPFQRYVGQHWDNTPADVG
jgi:hypothetical protein